MEIEPFVLNNKIQTLCVTRNTSPAQGEVSREVSLCRKTTVERVRQFWGFGVYLHRKWFLSVGIICVLLSDTSNNKPKTVNGNKHF